MDPTGDVTGGTGVSTLLSGDSTPSARVAAPADRTSRLLISGGVLATLVSTVLMLAIHLAPHNGGVNPVSGMLSDYAWRPLGWVFHLSLVIVGLGSAALWLALARHRVLRGWFVTLSMGVWCVSLACVALFTKDAVGSAPTLIGALHLAFTSTACGSLPIVCLLVGWRYRAHPSWRHFARGSLALALATVPCVLPFLLPFVFDRITGTHAYTGPATGLIERIMGGLDILALLVFALWAWHASRARPAS